MSQAAQNALINTVIQLKVTVKTLERQAKTVKKQENAQRAIAEKELKAGRYASARIHVENAVRKENEHLNLIRLQSRVDAVASRVQTARTMTTVAGNMEKAVKGMDAARKVMNLEKISAIMDGFEKNSENFDVVDEFTREATSSATAVGTPQDDVDRLMNQMADKVGVELSQDLERATPADTKIVTLVQDENAFEDRLRALRN